MFHPHSERSGTYDSRRRRRSSAGRTRSPWKVVRSAEGGRREQVERSAEGGRRENGDASGRPDGFELVARLHYEVLHARARSLTGRRADALDLLQDTFERALKHRSSCPRATDARPWLLTIMQNLHVDRCRASKRRRMVALSDDVLISAPGEEREEPLWCSVEPKDVRACLDRIDPRLRDAYLLQTEQGLSLAAVAARLAVPIATAGTRVFRARRRLRDLLEAARPA